MGGLPFFAGKGMGLLLAVLICVTLLIPATLFFRTYPRHILPLFGHQAGQAVSDLATVPAVEVRRGELVKTLVVDGELRAVNSRTIFASASDETKIVYLAPEGSLVKADDKVAELDNTAVLNRIKDLRERLLAAESEIAGTESSQQAALREMDVELSRLWLASEQAGIKAKLPADVSSRREYQENQLVLEKAKTEYEVQIKKIEETKKQQSAELQVKLIELQKLSAQGERARKDAGGMALYAPAEGMVLYSDHWNERRKVQVGDVVWGGFPLVSLPDLSGMEVVAQVSEVDGPKLSVGQKVSVLLDSYPQTRIYGQVKEIAQTAVKAGWLARAKVFNAVISLNQTLPDIMKPGMSAQVTIDVERTGSQLVVPRAAVKFDAGAPAVVRVEGKDTSRIVAVTILASDALSYAVADNGILKEHDRILSPVIQ